MVAADYLVLLLVVGAYLLWIFQGEHNYKPSLQKPEED
jgi:hypothetical protein